MTIWSLLIREIMHRKLNFALAVLTVVVASGSLIGSVALLRIHDVRTDQILEQKEAELQQSTAKLNDETRKAMLKLGFNIVILPKDQNLSDWYADDFAPKYMPEEYVHKLADSGIVTVRHFLPSLQQKVDWPEQKRKIILMGARGGRYGWCTRLYRLRKSGRRQNKQESASRNQTKPQTGRHPFLSCTSHQ